MKILHIASTDLRGAGSCVVALNALLNANGHSSKLVVVFKTKKDATIIGFLKPLNKYLQRWIDKAILRFHKIQSYCKVGKRNPDYFFYNLDERISNFSAKQILRKIDFIPEAIFVHWVSNFVNTETINELQQRTRAKIYWVMVDNAPITGGCHYPWSCKGYETDCSNCPALLSPKKKYIAQRNFSLKKATMPDELKILTLSTTDKLRAEKCSWYIKKQAQVIFHPINEHIFQPHSKNEARQYLNLPFDKKIIFFAATDLNERRKGYKELLEALTLLEKDIVAKGENIEDYLLITAGKQAPPATGAHHISGKYLGYLTEQEMVKAFNAATLFVCPTLEDSGPGILGQAILCGTPVVAFGTGAAADMLTTGITGYRAIPGDSADLAKGISLLAHLSPDEHNGMADACRKRGLETCAFEAVYKRLHGLLQEY